MSDEYLDWARSLAAESAGTSDRSGTLRRIDPAARVRGAASVRTGRAVSLARTLAPGPTLRHDDRPAFELQVFFSDAPTGVLTDPAMATATDHLRLDCHGIDNTHVDALNHTSVDGTWYGGRPVDLAGAPSIADAAAEGIFSRAVHLDIPALRGSAWVTSEEPVTGPELQETLDRTGVRLMRGDVLMVDMGRDRYEQAGGSVREATRPGIGASGARWLARQPIGALAWDFLDAKHAAEPPGSVHVLNWAIGLVLVDNCDFAAARELLASTGHVALFAAAPLPIPGGTGANLNPLVIV